MQTFSLRVRCMLSEDHWGCGWMIDDGTGYWCEWEGSLQGWRRGASLAIRSRLLRFQMSKSSCSPEPSTLFWAVLSGQHQTSVSMPSFLPGWPQFCWKGNLWILIWRERDRGVNSMVLVSFFGNKIVQCCGSEGKFWNESLILSKWTGNHQVNYFFLFLILAPSWKKCLSSEGGFRTAMEGNII